MKTKVFLFTVLAAFLSMTTMAFASSITSTYVFGQQNHISDQSYEMQAVDVNNDGHLDIGDELVGVARIDQIINTNYISGSNFGTAWTDELTLYFDAKVTGKSGDSINGFNWTFGATGTFGTTAGTMIQVFSDPSNNFDIAGATSATAIATASDGSPYWELGIANGQGGWTASAFTDDLGALSSFSGQGSAGSFNYALNVLSYGIGPQLVRTQSNPVAYAGLVDVSGNGSFDAPTSALQGAAPWVEAQDNLDAYLQPVPEPTTLTLLGLGLLGLAATLRRKRLQ
jgi:hypothetical protein